MAELGYNSKSLRRLNICKGWVIRCPKGPHFAYMYFMSYFMKEANPLLDRIEYDL
uniref:Uncharacterized protein n=1 Tax=Picea glauca TaxID=3330 RepID=A0A101M1G0_PICGL|nr:hypothetical protein ABT39_MTgene3843 [Picea glauca]QHR86109.1 hypothetical protein Q903MT_gene108 [Picea sitchensis]